MIVLSALSTLQQAAPKLRHNQQKKNKLESKVQRQRTPMNACNKEFSLHCTEDLFFRELSSSNPLLAKPFSRTHAFHFIILLFTQTYLTAWEKVSTTLDNQAAQSIWLHKSSLEKVSFPYLIQREGYLFFLYKKVFLILELERHNPLESLLFSFESTLL